MVKFFEEECYSYLSSRSGNVWNKERLLRLIRSLTKRVPYPNCEVQNLVLCYISIIIHYLNGYTVELNTRDLSYLWANLYHPSRYVGFLQIELYYGKYKMESWVGNGFFMFKLTNGKIIKITPNPQSYIVDLPKIVHKAINNA
jgi:hypothetical protein